MRPSHLDNRISTARTAPSNRPGLIIALCLHGRRLSAVFIAAFYPLTNYTMLEQISTLLENVETTVNLFITLREQLSDDDWDLLNESPLLSQLFDSLSDLEYTIAD